MCICKRLAQLCGSAGFPKMLRPTLNHPCVVMKHPIYLLASTHAGSQHIASLAWSDPIVRIGTVDYLGYHLQYKRWTLILQVVTPLRDMIDEDRYPYMAVTLVT